jgi:very-short-patch-repair endonuclease
MTRTTKITSHQNVRADKLALAKQLRREMTPAERRLWRALRRNAVDGFHFRRQQVIRGYIVDFYCDAAKLAIELDGGAHEVQEEYDRLRDKIISRLGVQVLRIPNEAMLDVEVAVEFIREALRTSGRTQPLTPSRAGRGTR